jgi:hypothetical protein
MKHKHKMMALHRLRQQHLRQEQQRLQVLVARGASTSSTDSSVSLVMTTITRLKMVRLTCRSKIRMVVSSPMLVSCLGTMESPLPEPPLRLHIAYG